jgi:hypothetical protein
VHGLGHICECICACPLHSMVHRCIRLGDNDILMAASTSLRPYILIARVISFCRPPPRINQPNFSCSTALAALARL